MVELRCRIACSAVLLLVLLGCAPRSTLPVYPQRDRERAERLNTQGLALIEQGRTEEAERSFRASLAADPYLGPAHCNLGVVLLERGRYFEAGGELRSACQLMPRAAQPRANLGVLYASVGRYGPAEENLRQAHELRPDDIEVIGQLARIHVRQNLRNAETLAWLQRIAAEDDDPAWRSWAGEQLIRKPKQGSDPGR